MPNQKRRERRPKNLEPCSSRFRRTLRPGTCARISRLLINFVGNDKLSVSGEMNPIKFLETCEHLLSSAEVSTLLNIHRETVYKYKKSGTLKSVRVGRAVKFDPLDVLHFLRK